MAVLVGYTSTTLAQGNFASATGSTTILTRQGTGCDSVAAGSPATATFMLDGQNHPDGSIFRVALFEAGDRSLVAYSDWIDDANVTVDQEYTVNVTAVKSVVDATAYIIAVEEDIVNTTGFFPLIRLSDEVSTAQRGEVYEGGATSGYSQSASSPPDPLPAYDASTGSNQNGMYLYFSSAAGLTISSVTDPVQPGDTVTITVNDSSLVTGVTFGGVSVSFTAPTGTTVEFTAPDAYANGLSFEQLQTVEVTDGTNTDSITTTYNPPADVDYSGTVAGYPPGGDDLDLFDDPNITAADGDGYIVRDPNNYVNTINDDGTGTFDDTGTIYVRLHGTSDTTDSSQGTWTEEREVIVQDADTWPYPIDEPSIPITWEWGGRHPMTQSRVRMFKKGGQ